MLPILRDILAAHKAATYRGDPDDLVFPTGTGGRRDKDNLRAASSPLPGARRRAARARAAWCRCREGLTPHRLRHTFASILIACGEDPISVMRQIGHTDPAFTLRVYTHLMSRDADERERLKALIRGERVIAHPAPPPRAVDLADYEGAGHAALAERGGSGSPQGGRRGGRRGDGRRHGACDLEQLPSGPPRWKARVPKAKSRLVERGWIEADSARGEWELSSLGRAKVRRDERASEPLPAMAEAELLVAA